MTNKPDNLVALHYQMTGSYVVDAPPLVSSKIDWWALNLIEGLQLDRERLIMALSKMALSEMCDCKRLQANHERLQAVTQIFTEDEREHLLLALSCIESELPEHYSLLNKLETGRRKEDGTREPT